MAQSKQIRYITEKFSNSGTRNEVRKRVVEKFMEEKPGTGKGAKTSKYDYYVETLSDGNRIFLTRPTAPKNGFDFLIRVENTDFNEGAGRKRDNPKHEDITNDLKNKKIENPQMYNELYRLIKQVYECKDIVPSSYQNLSFSTGYPLDLILGVIKWFFIEQDIRYWNYSGRGMFMLSVPKP